MYLKKGFPEKEDFVVCTVKTILASSVIVTLDEYEKKEGMVHVSEISRKWVRSIKTYMKPGTKLVCKVMEARPAENLITLSVRRVGAAQHRNKMAEWVKEKQANDIIEVFAKQSDLTPKGVYDVIGNKILEKFKLLYPTFIEIAKEGEKVIAGLTIEKKLAQQFTEFIQKRIVLPKAEIAGTVTMTSAASNGLEVLKNAITTATEMARKKKSELAIKYLGAPKYKFKLTASDFKVAEEVLKEISESLSKLLESSEGSVEFKREG